MTGVNGNGMHTNLSIAQKGKNLFFDAEGPGQALEDRAGTSSTAFSRAARRSACSFNPSVNAYRRLDPHYEAPNQIKASAVNRGAMVRIPIGNEKSTRIEIRSIAPDANPYLALYAGAAHRARRARRASRTADTKRERTKLPAGQHLRRDPALQGQQVHGATCSAPRCTALHRR